MEFDDKLGAGNRPVPVVVVVIADLDLRAGLRAGWEYLLSA